MVFDLTFVIRVEYGSALAAHAIGLIFMPLEPLPWDRKDFFKERKQDRPESLSSVARWRDPSHHGSQDFSRVKMGIL